MKSGSWFLAILSVCACAALAAAPNEWVKIDQDESGARPGSVLVAAPDLKQMFLVVPDKKAPFVRAFDLATRKWSQLVPAQALERGLFPYYQAAYYPSTKTIYCLSGGLDLSSVIVEEKAWALDKVHWAADDLAGLSWQTMACDAVGKRLVVVGADKTRGNIGWSRTVVYDIPSDKWTRLDVADAKVVQAHRELVAAKEAAIDLVGHTRLAWFRDPKGEGTEAERKALAERCDALKKMPQVAGDVDAVAALLGQGKALDALKAARALQLKIEEAAEAQYPVPCSRRNSPLVYDPVNRVFVLFGGDHEDYLMNDTWILDLAKGAWHRAKPDRAPSPRAGHALVALPKSGRIALYEGYVQSSGTDYGTVPYQPLGPRELWLFDPKTERWDLVASWPLPAKDDTSTPAPLGFFDGYASERYCPPELAATADDQLVLAAHPTGPWYWRWKRPAETWLFTLDPSRLDAEGREKLGVAPNQRLHRTGPFVAAFCEVPDEPKPTGLDALPDNQWVRLPDPPRNPCRGCRQRDWGTCVWDSDRDQVLLWGGGHCVRSASVVAHYSPTSGRIVEGYDADEPYGANGGGGFDSSLLNRAWVSVHNYNHYAYDPKCKLLVSARGYLYDPERMDWLRMERREPPFAFSWGSTCVEASPHGAVAWARKRNSEDFGLWLFDREKGWTDLEPKGKLFAPYCDSHGMVYDSKRDRMILSGVGGGYAKLSNGTFLAFDFKTRELSPIVPANPELAKTNNARELAYLDHADWVLVGELYPPGRKKAEKHYTRVYDCAANKMILLDAGDVADG